MILAILYSVNMRSLRLDVSAGISEANRQSACFTPIGRADGFFNRVGSVDGRFKLNENWVANVQAVMAATINPNDPNFNLFGTNGAYQADPQGK